MGITQTFHSKDAVFSLMKLISGLPCSPGNVPKEEQWKVRRDNSGKGDQCSLIHTSVLVGAVPSLCSGW